MSPVEAQEATITATRRFARRQESWFRPDPRVCWLPHDDLRLIDRALELVRSDVGQDGPR
jgi:tRNA dimethylallyltransferase